MPLKRPLCMAALIFAACVWILSYLLPYSDEEPYASLNKQNVAVSGTVQDKQFHLSAKGELSLYATFSDIKSDNQDLCTAENILVILDPQADESLPIGASARVQGILRTFSEATNHGEFDSRFYYRIIKTAYSIQSAKITDVQAPAFSPDDVLYRFRRKISSLIDLCFGEQDASVMKAILLGEKGWLSQDMKELYRRNGIIHILAISGLHISILGMGLYKILRKPIIHIHMNKNKTEEKILYIPIPVAAAICISVMLVYGRMTGMGPSSVRAVCMFMIRLGAIVLRRTYDLLTGLAAALILILIEQPLYIYYSGFWFSFAAVFAAGGIMPLFAEENVLMKTLSIPLTTLPVYMIYNGVFPVWSIGLNLLIIPLMPVILAGGCVTAAAGLIFLPAAKAAAFPVHFVLYFYYALCSIAEKLPSGDLITGHPAGWTVVLFITVLIFLTAFGDRICEFERGMIILSVILILTVHVNPFLAIHMADVGQGDGIIFESGRCAFMIDGGSSDKKELYRYQLEPLLNYYGIGRLDFVMVTHGDSDHCSGVLEMLQDERSAGRIKTLILPECAEDVKSDPYIELESLAGERNIPIHYLARGDHISAGNVRIDVVHPDAGTILEDNEMSLTLLLQCGDFTGLFTGDLEGEGEKDVLGYLTDEKAADIGCRITQDGRIDITLLKVAHHGSKGATSEAFLSRFDPQTALISAGRNNSYGHPAPVILDRLKTNGTEIFNTQTDGEITVETDGEKLKISHYLQQ